MGGKTTKTRKSYSFFEYLMETVFLFEATKTDDRDTTDDEDNTTTPASIPKKILHPYQGQVERRLLLPTKHGWEITKSTNW